MKSVELLTLFPTFMDMSTYFYKKYNELQIEIDTITSLPDWHKTPNRLALAKSEQKICAYSSVLYEALAAEAYINYYGSKRLGLEYFKNRLDKLDFINKYLVVTKLITGNEFPTSEHIFEKLQDLHSARTKLVHSKSVQYDSLSDNSITDATEKLYKFKGKRIENTMKYLYGVCKELMYVVAKMEGSEKLIY